jgi:hypothetical protein
MANRPANAGSHGAGPDRGPAGAGASPPVRHPSFAREPRRPADLSRLSGPGDPASRGPAAARILSWLPYLLVLAGAVAGLALAWHGSKYAGRGAGLVGASLLAGGLARLVLPQRYAGLLFSRRKASDVLAFAVFGAAVLAVAISLP